ncbi:MAG: exonuclease domain-containing protein, partial [Anaerolineales bacterium]
MQTIVALDLETTGLDAERDTIIEIGAVKFSGNRVEAEFASLVNPARHVPEFITGLTGIDDAMLRGAPRFAEIAEAVQGFIGDAPILGHNVRFDVGFLSGQLPLPNNRTIDTYELASVLIPNAGRYNLGSLGKELGIMLPATHRALDDARVTHGIFIRLLELARELPLDLLQEIVRLSEPIAWDGTFAFAEILRERGPERASGTKARKQPARRPEQTVAPPIEATEETVPLDEEEVASVLEHGGEFAKSFPAFEYRPEQVHMVRAVTNALSRGRHLMVEAGTGIGKSLAYLVPAALFAARNNTRVVISTNTINLQDQLIRKDIPDLERALKLGVRAAVLKGRSNYLCPRRLDILRRFGPRSADEMRVLGKVLVWGLTDTSGDRTGLNLGGLAEREVWQRLSAEDDACTTETCVKRTGGACPFHLAKTAAQSAHLLVVNHALLLSDVAAQGKVLPEYSHLIVDEGHHLESATTNALSFRLRQFDLERILKELGGSGAGLLANLLAVCKPFVAAPQDGILKNEVRAATDSAFQTEQLGRAFFSAVVDFVASTSEPNAPTAYATQTRILPATRSMPGWDNVEIAWDAVQESLGALLKALGKIHELTAGFYASGLDALEDAMSDVANIVRRL